MNSMNTGMIDLSSLNWIYPTTLLPLGVYIKEHATGVQYVPPSNPDVSNYVNLILGGSENGYGIVSSYLPMVTLPPSIQDIGSILEPLFEILNHGSEMGGATPMKYLFGELTDNIYEHSEFKNGMVMAQRYDRKGFTDICFYDDGITINGSFRNDGMGFPNDVEAIARAINGLSTKSQERGYGLQSSVRLCTEGYQGCILVISGEGALYIDESDRKGYILPQIDRLDGTLISIRVPLQEREVDIYEYTC
ncbi:MAG: hypothetical protein ACTSPB_22545 [Candidatus Thorarchaeota archaeon]